MEKVVSQLDHEGWYLGTAVADLSPLEKDVFLIPAGCIDQEPPPVITAGMRYKPDGVGGWLEEIIPLPDPEPSPTLPTTEQIISSYEAALDAHLDAVAQQHRYRDRVTFAMRAGYPGPYQAEGTAFGIWMDNCNQQAYALLQAVMAGEAEMPSKEAFIASLPEFVLP